MRPVFVWLAVASTVAAAASTSSSSSSSSTSPSAAGNQCYWIDGSVSTDSFRCDNSTTGHTTCCQAGAVCYSNGVCKVVNGGVQDWQRVGCTDPTWQDPSCLDECQQYAPGSSAGIRPCDGIESGNHYCCDPGPYIGSFACCKNSSSTFVLGTSLPTVLAQMPLSQLSTTSSSATSSTTSSATNTVDTTTTSSTSPTNSSSADSGSSGTNTTAIGLGVGLGVGIPIAALIAGAFWFFSRRGNKGSTVPDSPAYEQTAYGGSPDMGMSTQSGAYGQPVYQQVPGGGWGPGSSPSPGHEGYGHEGYGGAQAYNHSAAAVAPNMPKYGGPPNGIPEMGHQNAPVELPDQGPVTELPGSAPR